MRLATINERFNDKAGMIDVASDDLYQRPTPFWNVPDHQTTVGVRASARTLRALVQRAP